MKEIIFPESEEAAKKVTVEGWVSRNGRFYGSNEYIARYDGSTTRHCEKCGKPTREKYFLLCDECRLAKDTEKYLSYPEADWDGETILYSERVDRFFYEPYDVFDATLCYELTVEDLRLIVCEPEYYRIIDPYEFYSNNLPDEGDTLPKEIIDAFELLNDAIDKCKEAASWIPTNKRVSVDSVKGFLKDYENE